MTIVIVLNPNNPMTTYKQWAKNPEHKYIRQQVRLAENRDFYVGCAALAMIGTALLAIVSTVMGFSRHCPGSLATAFKITAGVSVSAGVIFVVGIAIAYRHSKSHKAYQEIMADRDGSKLDALFEKERFAMLQGQLKKLEAEKERLTTLQEGELQEQIEINRAEIIRIKEELKKWASESEK